SRRRELPNGPDDLVDRALPQAAVGGTKEVGNIAWPVKSCNPRSALGERADSHSSHSFNETIIHLMLLRLSVARARRCATDGTWHLVGPRMLAGRQSSLSNRHFLRQSFDYAILLGIRHVGQDRQRDRRVLSQRGIRKVVRLEGIPLGKIAETVNRVST